MYDRKVLLNIVPIYKRLTNDTNNKQWNWKKNLQTFSTLKQLVIVLVKSKKIKEFLQPCLEEKKCKSNTLFAALTI